MSIKARQAEDEPDYLKELLAQAGIDAQASNVAAKLQRTRFNFVGCVRRSPAAVQAALERARWPSCPRTFSKELRFSTYRTSATGPITGRGST